jgi:nitroreductase
LFGDGTPRVSEELRATNPTIELMNARCSTRTYSDEPITAEEKQAILHTAMRAPNGGNMMMYSIIEIEEQVLKDRLVVTCDDQPFIAKAPWVLVFVADMQKWMDLFAHCKVGELGGCQHRDTLGAGDLMSACADALIAAQNAVIAAESLGIGSCYIGDVIENGEEVAELLGLPPYALPAAMLCFGRPKAPRAPVGRHEKYVVMRDRYHRLTGEELQDVSDTLDREYAPHGPKPGAANCVQSTYQRKFASAFMVEMNRSAQWWIDRWETRA